MTLITATSIGLIGITAFFSFLGWRLRTAVFANDEQTFLARTAEIFMYCLAVLTISSHLFILMQATIDAGIAYAPVLRTIFIVTFIFVGLAASLGSIGIGIYLVLRLVGHVLGFNKQRGRGGRGWKG